MIYLKSSVLSPWASSPSHYAYIYGVKINSRHELKPLPSIGDTEKIERLDSIVFVERVLRDTLFIEKEKVVNQLRYKIVEKERWKTKRDTVYVKVLEEEYKLLWRKSWVDDSLITSFQKEIEINAIVREQHEKDIQKWRLETIFARCEVGLLPFTLFRGWRSRKCVKKYLEGSLPLIQKR